MDPRVIVITGASSGIGAELSRQMGKAGHSLILGARRETELKAVAWESGKQAVAVTCDVTRRADVERLKAEALKMFGRIDVWINNAGRGISRPVLKLSDEDVDEIIAVNLKSALYGMQVIVPYFQQQGKGHLINVSSFLARVPLASVRSVYSAAKAALNSLTANLRMDLALSHPGIKVSVVMPGVVATEFAAHALGATPAMTSVGSSMKPQTAEEVALVIAGLIETPLPEIYTNPASAEIVKRYYADVAAFEAGMRH